MDALNLATEVAQNLAAHMLVGPLTFEHPKEPAHARQRSHHNTPVNGHITTAMKDVRWLAAEPRHLATGILACGALRGDV